MDYNEQDLPPNTSVKLTPTADACWQSTGLMCPVSRMCERCMAQTSAQLTLFAEDSPARTSAPPGKAQDSAELGAASGRSMLGSSKKSSRSTSSSKTLQPFVLEDWIKYSGKSLRSATMRNGIVSPLLPLAHLTGGTGCGLSPMFPTPKASEHKGGFSSQGGHPSLGRMWPTPKANEPGMSAKISGRAVTKSGHLTTQVALAEGMINLSTGRLWPTASSRDHKGGYIGGRIRNNKVSRDTLDVAVQWTDNQSKIGGQLNPQWVSWLMGYPVDWCDLMGELPPKSRTESTSSEDSATP